MKNLHGADELIATLSGISEVFRVREICTENQNVVLLDRNRNVSDPHARIDRIIIL